MLSSGALIAQDPGSPCHAVRWAEGGHWTGMGNNGCGVDDSPNAPQPQGVVRCANAADTESGIDWNTTYDPNEFMIVPSSCIDPDNFLPAMVEAPFTGQRIAWFNFDVRPYAGLYDFQTIATGSYELNWALYADTLSQTCGTNMDNQSGNCAGALALLSCGTDFNGWAPQPFVTPIFDEPTNLYLVVWRRGATSPANDVFDFTFKARYGCGDFCFTELNGPDTVTCNPNGSYKVKQWINATNTTVTVTAPGNTGIVYSHTPFTFTTASASPAVNTGWVEVTFPASVANYSITFTPSTEANSDYCDILVVTGTAPVCCVPPPCPTLTGPTTVCPGSTTQFCVPTGLGGYSWSVTGNGTIVGPTNTECVSVTAGATCNSSFTLTLVVGAPGCTSSCSYMVTVNDAVPPMLTCPAAVTVSCASDVPAPNTSSVTTTDNCGGMVTVTHVGDAISNQTCANRYTVTRTYRATDACGNSATCAQTITVFDNTPPMLTCPASVTVSCASEVPAPNTSSVTTTDNCNTGTVTVTHVGDVISNQTCANRYTVTRTYRATDACGNSATCAQTITVFDNTPPMLTCPASVTVSCASEVPAPNTSSVTTTDNCNTGTVTVTHVGDAISNQTCANRYTITRTYRATDACGNSATCAQTITVFDNTPPMLTCPAAVTVSCASQVPAPNTMSVTTTDNCNTGTVTVTHDGDAISNQTCANRYTITRTYRATDACGNSATCAQLITVFDNTPPSLTCPTGGSLGCNPADANGDNIPDIIPTTVPWTDNCGGSGNTSNYTDSNVDLTGCDRSLTRTFTATDECGNSGTCAVSYTWQVVTAPVFDNCTTGTTDLGCNPTTLPSCDASVTASNECGPVTVTCAPGMIVVNGCNRTQAFTYTATACGLTSTCVRTFTWQVATAPVFDNCTTGTTDLGCNPTTLPTCDPTVTATNECGPVTVTCTPGMIVVNGCNRTQAFTYTATACGLTSTCVRTFTWQVATAPVFDNCTTSTTDLGCNPVTLPTCDPTVTASNECGAVMVSCTPGMIVVDGCNRTQAFTYTATACGLTSTCVRTFTWQVATAPVFDNCTTGTTNLGCNPATLPSCDPTVTASNECGPVTVTCTPGMIVENGCTRTQAFTYTATACGLTSTCVRTFTWTVDVTPPTFTFCPPGSDLGCNPTGVPAPGAATATDACGTPSITSSLGAITADGCLRSQTRTYTATDGCGNTATCTQVFTWTVDVTPPVFTFCPEGSDLGCNPTGIPAPGAATATDACGTPAITSALGAIIPNGCLRTQVRTYTATDGCGNTSTCTQVFTWTVDVTPPTFTFCPPGSDLGCNPTGVPAPGAAEATDACGTPTITSSLGGITENGCLRSQTRTYTATDGCGNTSTCTQVFTWTVDVTPPTFTFCPAGSDLGCNPTGVPAPGAATATDACGTPSITSALGAITADGCLRSQTRTYTATDGCGNTATCTQVFTWTVDVTPPVFTFCPEGSDLGCNPTGVPAPGAATATDACGTPAITSSLGTIIPNGCLRTQVRTYTATDGCGNTSTCTQVFTWTVDVAPPAITCPAMLTIECDATADLSVPANMTIATWLGSATATDACGTPAITNNYSPTAFSNGCGATGMQTVTFTATDACLNTSTCTAVIQIVDTAPPAITCPPTLTIQCDDTLNLEVPGNMVIENWLNSATATDACGTPTITNTYSPTGFSNGCGATGSQVVFFTATDECGNTSGCSAMIQIVDNLPPVCMAEDFMLDTVIDPTSGVIALNPSWFDGGSYDDCGSVTTAVFPTSVSCINEGVTVVTLTVTDECGNTSTCTANFTLNCVDPCIEIVAHVYLEGSATDPSGEATWSVPMRTTLNNLRLLPGQTYNDPFFGNFYSPPGQPYDVAPWFYMGNEGSTYDSGGDPMMGDANYPPTVVDWVLVSLRDTVDGDPLCQAAALLHNDGLIEFTEDFECCNLDLFEPYYVVVEHHNHLLVMSHMAMAVNLMNSTITYDFRNQNSYVDDPFMFGFVKGQKEILPGTWAMYAGNGEQSASGAADIDINQDDRAAWQVENGDFGYYRFGDYNMNGDVNFNDRVTWERNNGNASSVPRD